MSNDINEVSVVVTATEDGGSELSCVWRKATPTVLTQFSIFSTAILEVNSAKKDRFVYTSTAVLYYALGLCLAYGAKPDTNIHILLFCLAAVHTFAALHADRRIRLASQERDDALVALHKEVSDTK